MNPKTRNIINWVLAGLVAFIFIGSAFGKISGAEESIKMAESIGLDANTFLMLGIIEVIAVILFLVPRTGIIGFLLLVAYMGGAIATHLEHEQSIMAPAIIAAFVWIVGAVRFPELTQRLMGKTTS